MFLFCNEDHQNNVLQIYANGKNVIDVQFTIFLNGMTFYSAIASNFHSFARSEEELYNIIYRTGYLIQASYVLSQNEGEVQVLHKMSILKKEKVVFIIALFYLKHLNILMLLYCMSKKRSNILLF